MVERFHRQLKEGLRVRSGVWEQLQHLPWVMLGLRTAKKEEAAISSTEAVLGTPLSLPGQLALPATICAVVERVALPNTTRSYAEVAAGAAEGPGVGDWMYV